MYRRGSSIQKLILNGSTAATSTAARPRCPQVTSCELAGVSLSVSSPRVTRPATTVPLALYVPTPTTIITLSVVTVFLWDPTTSLFWLLPWITAYSVPTLHTPWAHSPPRERRRWHGRRREWTGELELQRWMATLAGLNHDAHRPNCLQACTSAKWFTREPHMDL